MQRFGSILILDEPTPARMNWPF